MESRPSLVEAIAWQESGWQNAVVSSANAQGVGQLLPQTATFVNGLLGTHLNLTVAADNIRMEVRFLAYLLQRDRAPGVRRRSSRTTRASRTYQHIGALPESQVYAASVLGVRPRFE